MSEPSSAPRPKPPGAYRLLHTADWHLGKQLNDRSRDEEHRLFLDWLLQMVDEYSVDVVLLAGDVFDTANPPNGALQQYYNFVSGLHRGRGCSLAIIAGNHDSPAQLEAPRLVLRSLDVHVVGSLDENPQARVLRLPNDTNPRVAIAMIPFLRDRDLRTGRAGEQYEEVQAQIMAGIRRIYTEASQTVSGHSIECPTIATGHLTVIGASTSDSERDIHIGGLGSVQADLFPQLFQYVALGHLHRPQTIGPDHRVCYSGSPIALSFSEAKDQKRVMLLDVEQGGINIHSMKVPAFRRLVRICTTYADLDSTLSGFDPESEGETSTLPAWVEVLVDGAAVADDLNERVMNLADGRNYEVLRVVRERSTGSGGIESAQWSDQEAIETLIDRPVLVFEELLARQDQLDGEAVAALRSAFVELLEIHHHHEADASR